MTRPGMFFALAAMTCAGWTTISLADVVRLHDGRVIQGEVLTPDGAGEVRIRTPMGELHYPAAIVQKIERGDGPPTANERPMDDPPVTSGGAAADAKARQAFGDAKRQADQSASAQAGLTVWQKYLADYPRTPSTEPALTELDVWRKRVAEDAVRFGNEWLPRPQVERRSKTADDLLAKALAEKDIDKAIPLFDDASAQHPYRCDIPFKKAVACYRAKQARDFAKALADVVRIEPQHQAARNNMAVVAAREQQWGLAVRNFTIAAAAEGQPDVLLDNLDQLIFDAEGQPGVDSTMADAHRLVRQLVDRVRKSGKHVGEVRWGNKWIKEADYKKLLAENEKIDRGVELANARVAQLRERYKKAKWAVDDFERMVDDIKKEDLSRRDMKNFERRQREAADAEEEILQIEEEVKKLTADVKTAVAKRQRPTHPGQYVLLDADGRSQLGVVASRTVAPPEPPKADPKDTPRKAGKGDGDKPAKGDGDKPAKPGAAAKPGDARDTDRPTKGRDGQR